VGGLQATGVAGSNGAWRVVLGPLAARKADKALTLAVSDGVSTQVVADVLVGEVWVCSGQSNMEWPVRAAKDPDAEVLAANYPAIREFKAPHVRAVAPAERCDSAWKVCTPVSAGFFSAVGYYFGRHLHRQLDGIPVGLVVNAWSGMPAEPYTPVAVLATNPLFEAAATNAMRQEAEYLARKDEMEEAHAAAVSAYAAARADWMRRTELDDPGASNGWFGVDVATNGWAAMKVPGMLEETDPGFKNSSFTVWCRREFVLPAGWEKQDSLLHMGPVDETDIVWVNGREVGRTGLETPQYWTVPRCYRVPAGVLKAGTNVLALRIMNLYGESGPLGTANMYRLEPSQTREYASVPLAGQWRYRRGLAIDRKSMPREPVTPISHNAGGPGSIYNGMVAPMVPYAIRGVIWYQGESNAGRAWHYRSLLPTMIEGWRMAWKQPFPEGGNFPFLIVQLANHMAVKPGPSESAWAELREAQALTAATLTNCALAVAIDIGDAADIHPKNKQDVGLRLGLAAEKLAYGRDVVYSGPAYVSSAVEGGAMRVTFRHVGGGLVAGGDSGLKGFAVAGADRKFVWADAAIDGATVTVASTNVPAPVAVRYAWADNPVCNLYNKEGLPAVPFRTDDWPGLTWPKASK
jgi:sialate O-acetylesterase